MWDINIEIRTMGILYKKFQSWLPYFDFQETKKNRFYHIFKQILTQMLTIGK